MDLIALYVFIFGLLFGSFANVMIYRMSLGKSFISPRSYCFSCKKQIPFYYNIPVISWLYLKGKCAFCKRSFSFRYPLIELLTGILFLLLYLKFGLSFLFFKYLLLVFLMIPMTFIDIDHMIIPNALTFSTIILGFVFSGLHFFFPDTLEGFISLWESFLGFLVGGGFFWLTAYFYYVFTKKEGLGGGDIKLLAGLGSFLGVKACLFIILASSVIGTIGGLSFLYFQKKDYKTTEIPFGPYICLATLIYLLFPDLSLILFSNIIM